MVADLLLLLLLLLFWLLLGLLLVERSDGGVKTSGVGQSEGTFGGGGVVFFVFVTVAAAVFASAAAFASTVVPLEVDAGAGVGADLGAELEANGCAVFAGDVKVVGFGKGRGGGGCCCRGVCEGGSFANGPGDGVAATAGPDAGDGEALKAAAVNDGLGTGAGSGKLGAEGKRNPSFFVDEDGA